MPLPPYPHRTHFLRTLQRITTRYRVNTGANGLAEMTTPLWPTNISGYQQPHLCLVPALRTSKR